ncbi:hypothetical protein NPIL_210751, partial [Nephila pilipes]
WRPLAIKASQLHRKLVIGNERHFKGAEVCGVMLAITTLLSVVICCNRVCYEEGPFEIERVNKGVRKADSIAEGGYFRNDS